MNPKAQTNKSHNTPSPQKPKTQNQSTNKKIIESQLKPANPTKPKTQHQQNTQHQQQQQQKSQNTHHNNNNNNKTILTPFSTNGKYTRV